MVINDEQINKNFYEECEWRFVDISEGFIFPEEISSSSDIELHNKKTVSNSLQFEPDDIRYILVETEDDVAEIVDFINAKLGRFTHDQLKRLITRIVVLNDLELDI
jgi:protein associated with RNAse G/E